MYRILLIDDNLSFRETFKELIVNKFYTATVFGVGSYASALKYIKVLMPELIFVDIKLPDGNGLNLSKEIKTLYPKIHIIVVSFYDTPEYFEAAFNSGADNYIPKNSLNQERLASLLNPLMAEKNKANPSL